ncbi:MAG: hypothetical protein ACNA78_10570, partial [Balneolaceae bacterium]
LMIALKIVVLAEFFWVMVLLPHEMKTKVRAEKPKPERCSGLLLNHTTNNHPWVYIMRFLSAMEVSTHSEQITKGE